MNEAEAGTTALTERQRYWLDHLRACAASGKSIAKYAAVHDLAAPAMYAGKRVLVKKGALPSKHPAQFQRVQLMKAVVDREWCVRLPNGASVLFSAAVDAATLAVVLNTTADLK